MHSTRKHSDCQCAHAKSASAATPLEPELGLNVIPEPFGSFGRSARGANDEASNESGFGSWFEPTETVTLYKTPHGPKPAPKPGMTAEHVCWVQTVLNQTQGEKLAADGIYGPLTRAAVVRFQTKHRLAADGIVGPRTNAALAQVGLNKIAGSRLAVNGAIDASTRQAIQKFQTGNGLTADGIVGPLTRGAMVRALGGVCRAPKPGPKKPDPPTPPKCSPQTVAALLQECEVHRRGCLANCGYDTLMSRLNSIPGVLACLADPEPLTKTLCLLRTAGPELIEAVFKAKECMRDCNEASDFCDMNARKCLR